MSRRALGDLAALVWLAAVAGMLLAPALAHGTALGPYDLLRELGVTSQANPHIHNAVGSDEIQEFIPWQALDWLQVHGGHLPLWNPDSLLGMPLAFNFESTPFSLTVAIGYLFPLHLAHSATTIARLLLAGSGAYLFARTLRLSPIAAAFGATVYELSGAFTIWLGLYMSDCLCLAGFVFAASAYLIRARRRALRVAFLAVALALALAGGEPQIAVVLVGSLLLFVVVVVLRTGRNGSFPSGRVLLDHGLAIVGAGGLVAPLYLPGIQLALGSVRSSGPYVSGLPLYDLTHLAFADYNGVPTSLGTIIGPDNLYVSMIYVGLVALVLGVVALGWWRSRPEVAGLAVLAGAIGVVLFASPVADLAGRLPLVRVFRIDLTTTILDFALAILAAIGAHRLVAAQPGDRPDRPLAAACAAGAVALAVLGVRLAINVQHLPPAERALRAGAFLWPSLSLAACCVALVLCRTGRTGRRLGVARAGAGQVAVVLLLGVETAFLVIGGYDFVSSSPTSPPPSAAVAALRRDLGGGLLGIGSCEESVFPTTGILLDDNLLYGVDELADYDPMIPKAYDYVYEAAAGEPLGAHTPSVSCPAITTVGLARLFGVSAVIEAPGARGPAGTTLEATIHGEGLYRVEGSSRVTLLPRSGDGAPVALDAGEPYPSGWRIPYDAHRSSLLVVRVTAVPGWHASLDGRPLALSRYHQIMVEAVVPAGRHVVTLDYWPQAFTIGLWIAAAAAAGLLVAPIAGSLTRRRSRRIGRGPALSAGRRAAGSRR